MSRIGKRIVWELSGDLWIVFHLMTSGRFHSKKQNRNPSRKFNLAAFNFDDGTLLLTETGTKKRASIHVHRGVPSLEDHHFGGLNLFDCGVDEFQERLQRKNRTLKKALVDPHRS